MNFTLHLKNISGNSIFIYERDIRKLAHSLASFDAFICAYTALLADRVDFTAAGLIDSVNRALGPPQSVAARG